MEIKVSHYSSNCMWILWRIDDQTCWLNNVAINNRSEHRYSSWLLIFHMRNKRDSLISTHLTLVNCSGYSLFSTTYHARWCFVCLRQVNSPWRRGKKTHSKPNVHINKAEVASSYCIMNQYSSVYHSWHISIMIMQD